MTDESNYCCLAVQEWHFVGTAFLILQKTVLMSESRQLVSGNISCLMVDIMQL